MSYYIHREKILLKKTLQTFTHLQTAIVLAALGMWLDLLILSTGDAEMGWPCRAFTMVLLSQVGNPKVALPASAIEVLGSWRIGSVSAWRMNLSQKPIEEDTQENV